MYSVSAMFRIIYWIPILYILSLQIGCSADFLPTLALKRNWKYEKKDAPLAYNDEMFNFDTLAGIGLGKRSGGHSEKPLIPFHRMVHLRQKGRMMPALRSRDLKLHRFRRSSPAMVVVPSYYNAAVDSDQHLDVDPLMGLPSSIRNRLISEILSKQNSERSPMLQQTLGNRLFETPNKRFYISQFDRLMSQPTSTSLRSIYDQKPEITKLSFPRIEQLEIY
ncbi:hypothetical protein DdX_00295 [Ditylenchus destructor]|uniref:Uncharacterized protein n=1 Tax=Ditylenchus destructor TaxID=166010 RepID=A0AAD4NKB3_9BILA|nr:hypothetical protein DdX_00295 [Ditylenchus destructor]